MKAIRVSELVSARETQSARDTLAEVDSSVPLTDGIPMRKELRDLYLMFKRVHRRVVPHISPIGYGRINDEGVIEVALCMPEDTHAMGYIGYYNNEGGTKYIIRSPNITNNKFRAGNPRYHAYETENLDRAFKHAKANIRPMSLAESVAKFVVPNLEAATTSYYESRRTVAKLFHTVAQHTALREELTHAYRSGHQFMNPEFHEAVKAMVDATNEANASPLPAALQYVYVRFIEFASGRIEVDVARLEDMMRRGDRYTYTRANTVLSSSTFPMEQLPEWLLNKVSALNLMEIDTYVAGLGVKRAPFAFFVERGSDELI